MVITVRPGTANAATALPGCAACLRIRIASHSHNPARRTQIERTVNPSQSAGSIATSYITQVITWHGDAESTLIRFLLRSRSKSKRGRIAASMNQTRTSPDARIDPESAIEAWRINRTPAQQFINLSNKDFVLVVAGCSRPCGQLIG